MADSLLKVDHVFAGYGKLQILSDVSLESSPNKITVIVGPNGSGKSTLLKTIAGLTKVYSGRITFTNNGRTLDLTRLPSHEIARSGIVYLPQTKSTFTQLTVAENLKMAGYTVREGELETRLENALVMFPKLASHLETKVSSLSGGERQMVAMSMALLRNPNIIMFDEPTANLAPIIATQVLDTITHLSRNMGMTILLVEQNASRALQIGHNAYLLVNGQTIFKGTAKELLEHKELGRLYLGLKVTQPAESSLKDN